MLLSRATLYAMWSIGLGLLATLITLAQHAPLTGETVWLWTGGMLGVLSERRVRRVRVLVDVLVGFLFLSAAVWSVAHLCGITITISWGVLDRWMALVPRPRQDLFPALLHGLLGMLAWACALSPPAGYGLAAISQDHAGQPAAQRFW